jgi:ABC-type branched-subunit amino acid transport system substrate-binding protein
MGEHMKAQLAALGLALALAGSTAPGRTQTATYTIPVILSQTGPAASPGGDQYAALEAYEKLVNRTGGIRGEQLHFAVSDDGSSPQTAVQLTNTILAQKPAVVIGSTLSPATTAMMPFFKDGPVLFALTPLVYPEKGSYVFGTLPLVTHVESVMFRYMRERGWSKVGYLRTNDVSGQDNEKAIDGALAEPANRAITITTRQLFNGADLNIAAQVSALKFSGAQALFVSATGAPFGTVLRSLSDAGVDLPIFTGATNIAPDFIARFKTYVPKSGLWIVFPSYAKRDRPARDPLRATIDEFYTTLEAAGLHPGAAHAFAWDEAKIVVAALRALGSNASAQQIHDWIEALHDFPGALGMYDFRVGDQHGLDEKTCYIVRYDPNAAGGGDTQVVSDAGGAPLGGH